MAYNLITPVEEPKLAEGEHEITFDKIPSAWFQPDNVRWNDEDLRLPTDPHGTLFQLRASDRLPKMNPTPKKTQRPEQKGECCLMLSSAKDGLGPVLNAPDSTMEQGKVKFSIQSDSQFPALTIENKMGTKHSDKEKLVMHRVVLHGNTSMKKATFFDAKAVQSGRVGIKLPANFKEAADEGRVLAITIEFGESAMQDRTLNSVSVLYRKTSDDMDRWGSFEDMAETMRSGKDKDFDKIVRHIYTMQNLRLVFLKEISQVDVGCMRKFETEYRHWEHIMALAIDKGPFWWYRMQPRFIASKPGAQLSEWAKADSPPPVPFWLVRKFRAVITSEGLTKLIPLEWTGITPDPTSNDQKDWHLAHRDYATFLHELSLVRERAWSFSASNILFKSGLEHPVKVTELYQGSKSSIFRVNISVVTSVEQRTESKLGQKVLPEKGSTLSIKLHLPLADQKFQLRGRVVEDQDDEEKGVSDLTALCTVSGYKARIVRLLFKDGKYECHATIDVNCNFLSFDRMTEGFRGVVADIDHAHKLETMGPHPDARSFLLGYMPRYPGQIITDEAVDKKIEDFTVAHMGRKASLTELCAWFGFVGLNETQIVAIDDSIRGGKGNLSIIHGPPATGKSQTLAALAVVLHYVFDDVPAVVTPSGQAADAIMEKLVKAAQSTIDKKIPSKKLRIVRFVTTTGTPTGGDVNLEVGPEGLALEGLDEAALRRRDLWKTDAKWAGCTLHEKKKSLAKLWITSDRVPKKEKESAEFWLEMLKSAVDGELFGEKKKVFKQADALLGHEILVNQCDILIGTLNSMGREEVSFGDVPVKSVIVDECAQASLGDICIPFESFKNTCIRAVIGGDDLQLSAFLASETANESALFAKVSVFRELRLSEEKFSVHLLGWQYRCHPHIYKWSNEQLYRGRVQSAATTTIRTELDKTVAQFLQWQLGAGKDPKKPIQWDSGKHPRVIAIDIDYNSTNFPGTASQCNMHEVEFGEWLRTALLDFNPPTGFQRVKAGEITIISPYRGQVSAFKAKMLGDKLHDDSPATTVMKSQGSETVIGISSFAKNDRRDRTRTGFVWVPANLNVWFTRQMRWSFAVGCFAPRWGVKVDLERAQSDNRTYVSFLGHLCSKTEEGVLLVTPADFKDWPGYSKALEPGRGHPRDTTAPPSELLGAISSAPGEQLSQHFGSLSFGNSSEGWKGAPRGRKTPRGGAPPGGRGK